VAARAPGDGDHARLDQFLKSCVVAEVGQRVRSTALYEAYRAFSIKSDDEPVSHKSFTLLLDRLGYKRHYSNVIWFVGVRLIDGSSS
jgi:hypothetical protein